MTRAHRFDSDEQAKATDFVALGTEQQRMSRFTIVLNRIARRGGAGSASSIMPPNRPRPQDDALAVAVRLARAAYMRGYRSRPRTETEVTADRGWKARYMKRYRAALRAVGMTPDQEAKAEVHPELGYRTAGMVGVNLAVAQAMSMPRGTFVQLIDRAGRR